MGTAPNAGSKWKRLVKRILSALRWFGYRRASREAVNAQVSAAQALIRERRYAEAIEAIEAALKANPKEAAFLLFLRAGCQSSLGQERNAKETYEEVLRIDPSHAGAAKILGRSGVKGSRKSRDYVFREGRPDAADVSWERATGRAWEELVEEAQKAEKAGDNTLLLRYQDKLIEMKPDHAISYAWRGATHLALGNFREAADDCRTCLRLDLNYWKARAILAQAEEWLSREPARSELDAREEDIPLRSREERAKDHALVLRHLNEDIAIRPKHAILYGARAQTHLALGNFREAIEDCKTCQRLNPKDTKIAAVLAAVEEGLNREVARSRFEETDTSTSPPHGTETQSAATRIKRGTLASTQAKREGSVQSEIESASSGGVLWQVGEKAFGRFEVREIIASVGGMGTVYCAWDLKNDTPVALKTIKIAHDGDAASGAGQFRKEADHWFRLGNHPGIVTLLSVEKLDYRHLVLVMEYVAGDPSIGATLGHVLRTGGQLPVSEAARIAAGICEAMRFAHEKHRLVHRDLKPANIFITASGGVKVGDFGLAVEKDERMGQFAGTPQYAAPEQWNPDAIATPATDIYAIGVMLFEMVCGRRPYELPDEFVHALPAVQIAQFGELHGKQPVPNPILLRSDLPPEIASLIQECLAKTPARRPLGGCAELHDRLVGSVDLSDQSQRAPIDPAFEDRGTSAYNRGLSADSLGHFEEALAHYRRAAANEPYQSKRSEAWCNMAKVLNQMGRFQEAVDAASRALRIDSNDLHARHNLANALGVLGSHAAALEQFDRMLALDPNRVETYLGKAGLLLTTGDTEGAAVAYSRAKSLKPDHQYAWNGLGLCAEASGDLESALQMFDHAIEIHKLFAEAHANRARILRALERTDEFEKALREARELVSSDQDNPLHLLHIGSAIADLGTFEEAFGLLSKALELSPRSAQMYLTVAVICGHKGQYEKAVEFGTRAAHLGASEGAEVAAVARKCMGQYEARRD